MMMATGNGKLSRAAGLIREGLSTDAVREIIRDADAENVHTALKEITHELERWIRANHAEVCSRFASLSAPSETSKTDDYRHSVLVGYLNKLQLELEAQGKELMLFRETRGNYDRLRGRVNQTEQVQRMEAAQALALKPAEHETGARCIKGVSYYPGQSSCAQHKPQPGLVEFGGMCRDCWWRSSPRQRRRALKRMPVQPMDSVPLVVDPLDMSQIGGSFMDGAGVWRDKHGKRIMPGTIIRTEDRPARIWSSIKWAGVRLTYVIIIMALVATAPFCIAAIMHWIDLHLIRR